MPMPALSWNCIKKVSHSIEQRSILIELWLLTMPLGNLALLALLVCLAIGSLLLQLWLPC